MRRLYFDPFHCVPEGSYLPWVLDDVLAYSSVLGPADRYGYISMSINLVTTDTICRCKTFQNVTVSIKVQCLPMCLP